MPTFNFRGSFSTFLSSLTASTDETLLSIENQTGSGVEVHITAAAFYNNDQSQIWATPGIIQKLSSMPSGGNTASKVSLGSPAASSSGVVLRYARASDNGTATAITWSGGDRVFATHPSRFGAATQARFDTTADVLFDDGPGLVLAEGEALVFVNDYSDSVVGGITNSNRRIGAEIVWEEWVPDAGGGVTHEGAATLTGVGAVTAGARVERNGEATLSGASSLSAHDAVGDSFAHGAIQDNFGRADSSSLGAAWTGKTVDHTNTTSSVQLSNSRAVPTGLDLSNLFNTSFPENQEVYATVADAQASEGLRLWARVTNENTVSHQGYRLTVINNGSTSEWYLVRDQSSDTTLITDLTGNPVIADGDKILLRVTGSSPTTLKAYVKSSGTWSQILSYTDNSPLTGSGKAGIGFTSSITAWQLDDFGAGQVPITHEGSTALSGTGSVTASGQVIRNASVAASGTGSVAASASVEYRASVASSGTGLVTSTSSVQKFASAALSGTGSVTTTAQRQALGSVTASGTGSLTVGASVERRGSVALSGTGSVPAVNTQVERFGSINSSGTGALTVQGLRTALGSVSASGTGAVNSAANVELGASVTLSGTGSLTASYAEDNTKVGSATLSGQGSLTTTGSVERLGQVVASGQGSVTAAGQGVYQGVSALSASSTLTVGASVVYSGQAALSGSSSASATGSRELRGTVVASGASDLIVDGVIANFIDGSISASGTGSLTARGILVTGELRHGFVAGEARHGQLVGVGVGRVK